MTGRAPRRSGTAVARGVLLLVVAVLTTAPSAQNLGELATKEAKRRQQVSAGKRYTADDLPADSGSAPTVPPAAQPEKPDAPVASDASKAPPQEGDTPPPKERRDESYWRMRANEIRTKIDQLRSQMKALEAGAGDLAAQIDQGAGGAASSERAVTQRALAHAQKDIESMQAEWDRFEARARSMNVPPAWIR